MNFWRFDKKNIRWLDTLQFDWPMLLVVACLCLFGLLMVVSTSMDMAMQKYNNEWFFVERQLSFIIAAVVVGFFIYHYPSRWWFDNSRWCLAAVIVLLFLVLFSPLGIERNGSHRWINLGLLSLQVSELAKLALILYLADHIHRHSQNSQQQWSNFVMPLLLVALTAVLILLAPDYGTAAIILAVGVILFFLAGIGLLRFFAIVAAMTCVMTLLLSYCSYCVQRFVAYLNPWADPYNDGYQLIQSLIAIGRGGWFGEGPGNSMQKLSYLTEAHNDFVFSIVVEEFGFLGALLVIVLYAVLIVRCFVVGRRAERQAHKAAAFFCYGVGVWFGLQAFGNMSVAVGLLPTKGFSLPLMSYGGSSLIVVAVMIAIVQRLYYELCRNDVVFMHYYKLRKSHA